MRQVEKGPAHGKDDKKEKKATIVIGPRGLSRMYRGSEVKVEVEGQGERER